MKKIYALSALFFAVTQAVVATNYVVTDQAQFDTALTNSAASAEDNTITVNSPTGVAINSATTVSGNSPNDLDITVNGVIGSPQVSFDINAPLTVNSDATVSLESIGSSAVRMNVASSVTQTGGQVTATNGSSIVIQNGGSYTLNGGTLQLGGQNALSTEGTGTFNLGATTAETIQVVGSDLSLNVVMHMDQPAPPTSSGVVTLDTNGLNAVVSGMLITANNPGGVPVFRKAGAGNLTLRNFTMTGGGEYHLTQGTAAIQNNVAIPYLAVGTGVGANVTMTISDSSANLTITQPDAGNESSTLQIGDFGGTAVVNQSAGTVYVHDGSLNISNQGGQGTYNISGGTINFTSLDPDVSFFNIGRNTGTNAATTGTLNITGGNVNAYVSDGGGAVQMILGSRAAAVGASSNGIINQTGGTLSIRNGANLYLSSFGDGVYNLTGGVLEIGGTSLQENYLGGPGTYQFNFGGTGRIHVVDSDLNSAVDINLLSGGQGVVDTNGFNATLSGDITGLGALVKQGAGTLFLTGANLYSGGTTVSGGTLQGNTTGIQGNILNNARVVFDQPVNGTYAGNMSGTGELIKNNVGTLFLTGTNSYSGGTTVSGGTLQGNTNSLQGNILNNAAVVFDQAFDGTYSGNMTGSGSLAKLGNGTLILTGTNSYSNGTAILAGALQGDTQSLQGNIDVGNNTLIFNQTTPGIFNGTLFGGAGAVLNKIGASSLTFNTDNSTFTGTTNVLEGILLLNNLLGGNINVLQTGVLGGTGTVLGNLNVDNGGSVSVGPGTLNVAGNYNQGATGNFLATLGALTGPYLNVGLGATIDGTAQIRTTNGFNVSSTYSLLHADGGLTGTFSTVTASPILTPLLTYTATDVLLQFQADFTAVALTRNQESVANQLNLLSTPTPTQEAVLNEIIALSEDPATIGEARRALNELSGQQYTNNIVQAELNSYVFTNQIYDALRSTITASPCACTCPADSCGLCSWLEVGGGPSNFKGNREAAGFDLYRFTVAGGIHKRWNDSITAGVAGAYDNDRVNYCLTGHNRNQVYSGAVYALYRPSNYYIWGDIAVGCNRQHIRRPINVGTLHFRSHSKPRTCFASTYAEAGFDICQCNALIQPFVGIQAGYARHECIREHGSDFNLRIHSKMHTIANSRLGAHVTSDNFSSGVRLSLDVAWLCRLSPLNNSLRAHFTTFGDSFEIVGAPFARNSVYWGLTASKQCTAHLEGYVQANGQHWCQANAYNFMGGINCCW